MEKKRHKKKEHHSKMSKALKAHEKKDVKREHKLEKEIKAKSK